MPGTGTLIALAPLLIALYVTAKKWVKARKADPMTADDKEIVQECRKAAVYIFVAATILWWFTPSFGTGMTILWTILTTIFATVVILTVVDLPDRFDSLDDRIWTEGPKTPVYSKSGEPVEYIRWARRIMLAVLVVTAIFCVVYAALTTTSSADETGEDKPAAAAPAAPTTGSTATTPAPATTTSAPATSSSSTPAAPATFKNECGGPDPKKVTTTKIDFKTGNKPDGTPGLYVCHDGDWKTWDQAFPGVVPPTEQVDLTHWVKGSKKGEGYGVVVINNNPVLFWATVIED